MARKLAKKFYKNRGQIRGLILTALPGQAIILTAYVEDDKGRRFRIRDCLPVPSNSKDAKASADVGSDAKRDAAR